MKCQRSGCGGDIEDGYCNVCGLAPPKPARQQVQPASAGTTPPAAGPRAPTPQSGPIDPARPGTGGTGSAGTGWAGPGSTRTGTGPGSTRTGAATVGTRSGRTTSGRTGSTRTRTTGRSHLGAGLVEVPVVPYVDPSTAVMSVPEVAQDKRFCGHCGQPVGRDRAGVRGRTEGFCRVCGRGFSFTPKLVAGDLVATQYEVVGCLAHGGLGWIYLARDHNVSDRWVVLKGLLDADDPDAMAAALAERRFLAEVEHPNIVKIFNFVQHKGSGYIVMEYVGGTALKDLLKQRREANGGVPDPLPIEQASAYVLEILPALGYLHSLGLLFCDFKPDNVIQAGEALKLIDLGGVRRIDDDVSAVYGTVGYQAPEIADLGPSVSSDLYTVARTLAVLSIDFKGYQGTFKYSLPQPDDVPLLARFDSLYRFLLRGIAVDPAARFQSADEMAEQLIGVLREVVSATDGRPRPAPSNLFTSDLRALPERADWRLLPALKVGADDPAAGFLATITSTDPDELVELLRTAPVHSVEIDLRLARSLIEVGDGPGAAEVMSAIAADDPAEWRVGWYRGLAALDQGDIAAASEAFDRVYSQFPGELAPKLALGVTAEIGGQPGRALAWYNVVSRTDQSFTTAAFGLARCRVATGDRIGAVEAYNRVPDRSSSYLQAQICAARTLIAVNDNSPPGLVDLTQAGAAVEHLALSGEQRAGLTRELLEAALSLVRTGKIHPDPAVTVAGEPCTEQRLRVGLEKAYRTLAHLAPTEEERISLVDRANQTRPRTWL
jgi:serine/threonine-protein kinase PknG